MGDIRDEPARLEDGDVVSLPDGGRVFVRALRPSDRDELSERYLALSPAARRLRFFNAPDHLSARLLDYLVDDDGAPGVGIARYARSRADPSCAEAAVTVLDAYQSRGIATELLHRLAERAREHGITTFTASVMWENSELLDGLRAFEAQVQPCEPGVASVRIPIPPADVALQESELHRILRVFAERIGDAIGLRFER